MENMRAEKIEALETLLEFNGRLLQNMRIIVKELSGKRLDDTDKFLADILKAMNWEIQVVNATLDVINEKETKLDKNDFNEKVIALNDAYTAKDDAQMAEAFNGLIPVFENLDVAVKAVVSQKSI